MGPEGYCVGLRYIQQKEEIISSSNNNNTTTLLSNNNIHKYLHKNEILYGIKSIPSNTAKISFYIGRVAMHIGLKEISCSNEKTIPILKDNYGRPIVPYGYLGSISHKKYIGVSLVDKHKQKRGIGIDIEQTYSKINIEKRVLTENEIMDLGSLKVFVFLYVYICMFFFGFKYIRIYNVF